MVRSEKVEFPGHSGGMLAARLDMPVGRPRAFALFAHCFSCSKDLAAARRLSSDLARQGIAVLRFDFTGLGHSEGDFANTNFSTNVQDLRAAADWLAETHGGPHLLIGHSLGGAAVLVVAKDIPSVRAVATIGAPSDAEHVLHNIAPALDTIEQAGEAEVLLAGRPFRIQKQFLEDVRGAKVRDAVAALNLPVLVMHAPRDDTVGIDNATHLFLAAKHPKSFVSLDKSDHLLSGPDDAAFAASVLSGWAVNYLPDDGLGAPPRSPDAPFMVRVQEVPGEKFTNWVVTRGGHAQLADEPAGVSGNDLGPSPYEYLQAALGACTAMTLRMYAARKGWPLDQATVDVHYGREHAADCAACEDGVPADVFTRSLTLTGALDAEQRARLMEIADKCPVHKTLESPGVVRTETADA